MPPTAPGFRSCPVDRAKSRLTEDLEVRPDRFQQLHVDGRELVTRWIKRANAAPRSDPFEAFIYAWIGFNGWATCVCDEDTDSRLIQMLQVDPGVTANFADLMSRDQFRAAAYAFSSFWPIFRVSDLPDAIRRRRPEKKGRRAVTEHYHSNCPTAARAPDCHLTHSSPMDPDWAHTLEALYRVRCNLFHGQKSGGGMEDQAILRAAVAVLLPVASSVLRLS